MSLLHRRTSALVVGLLLLLSIGLMSLNLHAQTGSTPSIDLDHLPRFASGVRTYPPPLLAIAKSPRPIASPAAGMNIQSDVGYLAGFSGFVDETTGQFGFPGYRNHSIVNFAFDDDKLVIQTHVPYPEGRALRAHTEGDLLRDDMIFTPKSTSSMSMKAPIR